MQLIQKLETRIDLALSDAGAGETRTVDIDDTVSSAVFDTVGNDYRAVGWKVACRPMFAATPHHAGGTRARPFSVRLERETLPEL